MKHFLLTLLVAVVSFGFSVPDVEAKRLGGGSSFGMKRQATPQSAPRQPAATQQTPGAGAANAAQPRRSWMGPIAGLAAGLGLAALFSHLGLGEEMASFMMILLLAGAAFLVFRMLMRRRAETQGGNRLQYAGGTGGGAATAPNRDAGFAQRTASAPARVDTTSASGLQSAVDSGFDRDGFARQAKLNFIRLQTANDQGNLADIREFTTPEVFAEIQLQLSERGGEIQRTDIVELNADVVDLAEEDGRYIVSVRFNGLLREEEGAAPTAFDEIWHLVKPVSGSGGWLVAGIQQVA